jgi:predicted anti-sigma-YlaC factor YlaD
MSAHLDGELAAAELARAESHLEVCVGCQQWRELAFVATRRARVGVALPPPDLTERVMAAVVADVRRRRSRRYWLVFARAVVAAGLLQLLATVPLLVLARSGSAGHGREDMLGVVELVIGAGFFVGALVVLWQTREQSGLEVVRSLPAASPMSGDGVAATEEVA